MMTAVRWWKRKWLPWPSRDERKRNVKSALHDAENARRGARRAAVLAADLRAIETDKLAWALIETLGAHPRKQVNDRVDRDGEGDR